MQLTPEQQQALEAQKANCPFCKIVKGEIQSKKVYEDEKILAILDINPATKGHTLVLPKEHYPILPLLPAETFLHLAAKLKEISKSVREGMLVFGDNIFVANGMAAGQQSQHFLLHVIPREKNDNVEVFELKQQEIDKVKEEELYKVLKQNLPLMLRSIGAKFPLQPQQTGQSKTSALPAIGYSKEELLTIIEKNLPLKRLLIENPDQFRQIARQNQQLQLLFKNVDVEEIITIVRKRELGDERAQETEGQMQRQKQPVAKAESVQSHQAQPSQASLHQAPLQKDVFKEMEDNFLRQNPAFFKQQQEIKEAELADEHAERNREEQQQYDYGELIKVLNNNPKLRYLLLHDLPLLKQKVAVIAQLQELFKGVDINRLRKIIEEQEKGAEQKKENKNQEDNQEANEDNLISRLG